MRLTMPRQHEARVGRIKQRAVEQLEIKAFADADRLVRQARFVPVRCSDRTRDRSPARTGSHRRQGEQLAVGERDVGRSLRQQHAAEAKSSAIEFAQRQRDR